MASKVKVKVPRLTVISCLVLAACSGDRVNETIDELSEALTSTQSRILEFDGQIGGTGADWTATTGTATSTTTHSSGTAAMALRANTNPQAKSATLGALGTLSGNPTIDVRFPTGYVNQGSFWGNADLFVTCPSASINNQSLGAVSLTGPTAVFKSYTFAPLTSTVANALATKTDCTVSVRLSLSNSGSLPVIVDRLFLGQTSGSGGTGGTGGIGGAG